MKPECSRCRFFQPSDSFDGMGDCHEMSPHPTGDRYAGLGYRGEWAVVHVEDWCGQFKPRTRASK